MLKTLKALIKFIEDVAKDERIPGSDKTLLLIMLALVVSPIDLIPDWIPILGVIDDLVILGIVLDYFFNHLDQAILLSHYPWGMKSFVRIRRVARTLTVLTPRWIKNKIWAFRPSVYTK